MPAAGSSIRRRITTHPTVRSARARVRGVILEGVDRQVDQLARVIEVLTERHYHGLPLPPAELRMHVGANDSAANYLGQGINSSQRVLEVFGDSPARPVLDWGCGSGRTLRWLRHFPAWRQHYHGCDVDAKAIAWLQGLGVPNIAHCPMDPPLPYSDGTFGGVVGFSILTHIHPTRHRRWCEELRRVLINDGVAYLTFHGSTVLNNPAFSIPEQIKAEYRDRGYAYFAHEGHYKDSAIVHPDFIRETVRGLFTVESYEEPGYQNQDATLLRAAKTD